MLSPSILGFWFFVIGVLAGIFANKQVRDAGERLVDNATWFGVMCFGLGFAFAGAILITFSLLRIV